LFRLGKHVARILLTVLLGGILGATLVRVAPGFGVDEEELDSRLNDQSIRALRQAQQTDTNLITFYFRYLNRMLHGELGISRTLHRPVSELLKERFPETAKSVVLSLALGWALSLALIVMALMSRSWSVDFFGSMISGLLLCLPAAVLAILFVITRTPARFVLALIVFPNVYRYARNLLVRSASQPHVLMAQAKGLGNFRIIIWHVLLPAAQQLLALAGVSVSLALTAAIPVEALCDLPGIGQLAWRAALGRDLYLLVNLTMVVTVITLLANSASNFLGEAFRPSAA
jgi:peptide/nickel transport system permease protein